MADWARPGCGLLFWIGSRKEEHFSEAQPDRFAPRRRVMRDDDGGAERCSWPRGYWGGRGKSTEAGL